MLNYIPTYSRLLKREPLIVLGFPCTWDLQFLQHQLTSRQETDSSAHLDKRSKEYHVILNSRFDLHSPEALYCCFRKQHGLVLRLHYSSTWTTRGPVQEGVVCTRSQLISQSVVREVCTPLRDVV